MDAPVDSPAPKSSARLPHPPPFPSLTPDPSSKTPVVRGARACTVCRAAKMKCVGAEDGRQSCQRCRRASTECVFEKHRRGRKPGSKLSEASKMLRRLEKGLNNAKMKSITAESALPASADPRLSGVGDVHVRLAPLGQSDLQHYRQDLAPRRPHFDGQPEHTFHSQVSGSSSMDEDEIDGEPNEEGMYPAKLIKKERQRNSFFGTVLGPGPTGSARSPVGQTYPSAPPTSADVSSISRPFSFPPPFGSLDDPVQKGFMDEQTAENMIDLVLIRLNPFINLFDPELHSLAYIRKKCPFLFTTLLMAGTKFFNPQLYPKCRELADLHAVTAFAEARKSVEIVQAFMCLTYWREPDDTRTWTYIGYACRMAVELGLNRYSARPPETETTNQRLERRNRERTYLVLFVHDRSLSMQTGRLWMLPEDELVIEAYCWHEQVPSGTPIRPEDVIVSAFVALRQIATETTKMFELQKGSGNGQPDNYDFLLNACNSKLSGWATTWSMEMKRAQGEPFHHSFLEFFQLYVGLFLNSFGIYAYMSNATGPSPSLRALGTCYGNASRCLEIIVKEFARVQMLQYSQESITTMTAYCAVMLLRLLRKSNLKADGESSTTNVLALILSTSVAYREAGTMMPSSSSCAAHARFLSILVEREREELRNHQHRMENIDPTLLPFRTTHPNTGTDGSRAQPGQQHHGPQDQTEDPYSYSQPADTVFRFPNPTPADHLYYDNMCRELGVTQGVDLIQAPPNNFHQRLPNPHSYTMMGH
ncbi:hypothetical protein M0805_003849 [Coniferiporia weirii]|nr:hypothetical protein M0805_003849 [Coniferiporia weirii]